MLSGEIDENTFSQKKNRLVNHPVLNKKGMVNRLWKIMKTKLFVTNVSCSIAVPFCRINNDMIRY
jgi:hypothetical protein